jgi:nucleotide-binding universal stress UspA family protein
MKTFVLGYDDTEPAKRARSSASSELARALDAFVVVVSVAPGSNAGGSRDGSDRSQTPELHREELRHAKAVLDKAAVAADYEVGLGDSSRPDPEAAEKRSANMIVVGTREPGFISRIFGLSVSGRSSDARTATS